MKEAKQQKSWERLSLTDIIEVKGHNTKMGGTLVKADVKTLGIRESVIFLAFCCFLIFSLRLDL